MLDTQKCRFCRNAEVRHGIIGTSYLCAVHNSAKVKKNFCCEKFVQDDDMVLEYALFKARDPHKKVRMRQLCLQRGNIRRSCAVSQMPVSEHNILQGILAAYSRLPVS